ncbi:hypothetical protein Tco_1100213 [Tanacetum coccineum]
MSFSKLTGKNTPQCYTKPLGSLKNWNNHFLWVDERVFPTVVDWRESAPKDEKPAEGSYSVEEVVRLDTQMDLFHLISAPNHTKVNTGTHPRATHEVLLLTVTANRVIDMGEPDVATKSSGTPSTIERSPLNFSNENPSQQINEGDGTEDQVLETGASKVPPTGHVSTTGVAPNIVIEEEDAADVPLMSKRRRKRVDDGANANAPPKVLKKDFDVSRPAQSIFGGKSFASTGLEAGSTLSASASQGTPAGTIDQDQLSFAEQQPAPIRDIAESSKGATVVEDPNSDKSSSFTSFAGNLETLLEAEVDMKKAAEANSAKLTRELESLRAKFADHQVNNNHLFQQVSTLQAQVTGKEQIKAAFEEFKKREDDKVERRCAEIDARLDALSIDFDEELYPHMLTAIAGRRWVIKHGLRLAVMKCAESTDLRQVFANFVSAGIAKGVSEGLKHGVEHGKTQLDLKVIDAKYVAALHALKDLKYPLIDHLEKLKDAPIDLIMASLHLESDVGEETPQWIRELRPSSSQLKITVYPEVCDPRYPWAFKEEMMLEDAIMANVSRDEKKKCLVVCRTHGIGSAHHPRSDGIPVSVPTVAPQGLAILLADASTRTETTEDEASPQLIRSKSLPPMYNLDWP